MNLAFTTGSLLCVITATTNTNTSASARILSRMIAPMTPHNSHVFVYDLEGEILIGLTNIR